MSEIVVINHVSLDGVMQAPGRPDEDRRDGFEHGGWAIPNNDEVMYRVMGESMSHGYSLLLGRRTYEDFYSFWPAQTDNPFTDALNRAQKFVASRTLSEPLPWQNSTLLAGEAAESVGRLRKQEGHIVVLGSGDLIQSLMANDLIDRYVLMIHPLVLGRGRRLFGERTAPAALRLVDSATTTKGVVITTYEPEPASVEA